MALNLDKFRFGYDGASESTYTFAADVNANFTGAALDTTYLLRINLQESNVAAANNVACTWQFRQNLGTWTTISTNVATPLYAVNATAITNNQDTTQRLGGTGVFRTPNTGCTEDGTSGGSANDIARAGCSEQVLAFRVNSAGGAVAGDYFDIRVTGSTTITLVVTPRLYVVQELGGSLIPSTQQLFALAAALVLTTALIPAGSQAYDGHSITVEDQEIILPLIPVGSTLYTPTVPKLVLQLHEGTTLRATRDVPLTETLATYTYDLTPGERASITNWWNLRSSMIADGVQVEVTWLRLEAPYASSEAVTLEADTIPAGSTLYAPSLDMGALEITNAFIPEGSSVTPPYFASFGVRLLEGTTQIAEWVPELTTSLTTFELTLSTPQRNAISDWGNLRLSFTASTQQAEVTWARLEAPPAVASSGQTLELPFIDTTASVTAPESLIGEAFLARLLEGTTVLKQFYAEVSTSYTTSTLVFAPGELDVVTDWSDLRVELIADGGVVSVSWIELETPEMAPLLLPTIPLTSDIYAPSIQYVTVTALTGAPILNVPTLFPPEIHQTITGTTIIPTGEVLYAPTVAAVRDLVGAWLENVPTLYAPDVFQGDLTVAHISSTEVVWPLEISMGPLPITGAFVDTSEQLWAPTVARADVTLLMPTIGAASSVNPPSLGPLQSVVFGSFLPSTLQLHAPSVARAQYLTLPTISNVATFGPPTLGYIQTLTVPFHASTLRLFIPIVEVAGGETVPPTITILNEGGLIFITSEQYYVVSGRSADNMFVVTSVTWSNHRGGSGTATGVNPWYAKISLARGANVLTFTATDAAGNTSSTSITVIYTSYTHPPTVDGSTLLPPL